MNRNPASHRPTPRVLTRTAATAMTAALTPAATLVVTLAMALASGCGGRTFYEGEDAGANNSNANQNTNQNTNQNSNQNNQNTNGECQGATDCVAAIKEDVCCACPVSASPADLAADPCLVPLDTTEWPDGCYPGPCPPDLCLPCATWDRTPDCQGGLCVFKEGQCTWDDECVVAIRTDNCCEMATAAARADVEADPCLEYWSGYSFSSAPAECMERWDPECEYIDCMPSPPPSRATICGTDGCAFQWECATVEDCVLLLNHRECCPCPSAWPELAVGRDPCLTAPNTAPPAGCRPTYCADVACDQCPQNAGMACDPAWGCYDEWYYPGR